MTVHVHIHTKTKDADDIVVGKSYKMRVYDPLRNAMVEESVKVTNYIKRPDGSAMVEYSVRGKVRRVSSAVFKAKAY